MVEGRNRTIYYSLVSSGTPLTEQVPSLTPKCMHGKVNFTIFKIFMTKKCKQKDMYFTYL